MFELGMLAVANDFSALPWRDTFHKLGVKSRLLKDEELKKNFKDEEILVLVSSSKVLVWAVENQ